MSFLAFVLIVVGLAVWIFIGFVLALPLGYLAGTAERKRREENSQYTGYTPEE